VKLAMSDKVEEYDPRREFTGICVPPSPGDGEWRPFDMIIGTDLLAKIGIMAVDFNRHELTLRDPVSKSTYVYQMDPTRNMLIIRGHAGLRWKMGQASAVAEMIRIPRHRSGGEDRLVERQPQGRVSSTPTPPPETYRRITGRTSTGPSGQNRLRQPTQAGRSRATPTVKHHPEDKLQWDCHPRGQRRTRGQQQRLPPQDNRLVQV
jgi:hypothetical protein